MSHEAELVALAYGQLSAALAEAPPTELARPTRAAGWSVADLTFHLLLDAQRVLVTLATPSRDPADVDRATYWQPFRPGADSKAESAHAEYVRRSAAAYGTPQALVRHWNDTAAAAVRAAQTAPSGQRVATQGHVLDVPDFLSTIVVEAAVHYLDLTLDLSAAPLDERLLAHTVAVLEQIADAPLDTAGDRTRLVLTATGRAPSDDPRFPLLG